MGHKRSIRTRNMLLGMLTVGLVGTAVLDQLRRPPQQQPWHGSIPSLPYDFRLLTLESLRAIFWN